MRIRAQSRNHHGALLPAYVRKHRLYGSLASVSTRLSLRPREKKRNDTVEFLRDEVNFFLLETIDQYLLVRIIYREL